MKIIDLLNKKANGEETPKKFIYDFYTFTEDDYGMYKDEDGDDLMDSVCCDFSNLNEEIEIIEDKPYMGMMTRNFVCKNDTQDAKFDLYLIFGNDYKGYTIDTYNKTIVKIQDNKKEILEEVEDKEYVDIEEIAYKPRKVQNAINSLIRNQKKIIEVLNDKNKDSR